MSLRDTLSRKPDHDTIRSAVKDKVVVITGGARGIGFETATQLFDAGAKVAIGDIDGDAVGKAAADLGIEGIEVDVTKRESFDAFLTEVESRLGPIDVLVNNAGIMPVGPFLSYDDTIIRRTFDIDVIGVILGCQEAARRMAPRRTGHIVNIASTAGRIPTPGLTIYNGAKSAVIEFSEALGAELAPEGIKVSAVLPTFTRTALISGLQTNKFIQTVEPGEVAAVVVETIARPVTRVYAPRSMRWADSAPLLPQAMKRLSRKLTKLDSIFMNPDQNARAAYSSRIRGEKVDTKESARLSS
ncbi:SDR family oxidoreductase [Gordonia sp. zg691]|uniref:SDR family oxidoreductase n=1 Tax=Gordonia jinghuaiqii TaxID=2758710 RepID=A0A7D7LSJ3_9ACTN|nr:SDR family oxidoreductase [Gordonia jinghuaiqii]MBD0861003.1 SDR family oxidoreductase [Gordonia jinghuaiqii]MCR5979438.1 SDR family NAD(P)-dependent oxidoreductase [Gordonia jinghuaiqii]MCR5979859.1 SDR family NAD(P)-dependent oxidoreductase [Gordonia jinghuaiqii]QMT00757.1 SDR family oxidoreductase [Gordonia jinghuaiqii]